MAKQSGLHQIKGKVGGFSYYRQSGVNAGLMRRINEAMSGRVKTGEEFANTRLNNDEFKVAANLAKALGLFVVPKFRPMMLSFSQSKLTKDVLALLKANLGNWGYRYVGAADNASLLAALNSLAKNQFVEKIGDVTNATPTEPDEDSYAVQIVVSVDKQNALKSLGADGIEFRLQSRSVYVPKITETGYEQYIGMTAAPELYTISFAPTPEEKTFTMQSQSNVSPAWLETDRILRDYCIVAMPFRVVNGVKHTLQELCSFIAGECDVYGEG